MGALVAVQAEPEILESLRRCANGSSGRSFEAVAEPGELIARLERGEPVDAVVLGSRLEEPVRVAQRVHSLDRDVAVLMLSDPGGYHRLVRAVQFAPLLGEDIGCWSVAEPETVVEETKEALTRARKRRSYRATIAAASADATAIGLPQPRAEQYLDRLLDHVPIAVVMVDEDGLIRAWNRKAGELFDRSEREALGTPLARLFPEAQRERLDSLLAGCFASDEPTPPEVWRRETARGRVQFLETTAAPLTERTTRHDAIVLMQDVTERKQAQDALEESEERFRLLAEGAMEGIVLIRGDRIFDANRSYAEMFGYELEELVGMDVARLSPPDLREEVMRRISTGNTEPYEARGLKKDGTTFPIEVRPRSVPYHGRRIRITSVIDLSERRRTEETMRQIREAERRRVARDLHDGVLQDLSYATVSLEATRLQAQGTGLEEDLREGVEVIRSAAQALRAAVHDLRLADELDQPFPRPLESLVERNRGMARGQHIELEVKEGFPTTPLGETGVELLRIIQEALTNARRHSGARHVLVSLWGEERELVAEVSDDGRGLGPDAAPGVGLRSMRERAAALGGELEVRGEPGSGTTVRVRVPRPGK